MRATYDRQVGQGHVSYDIRSIPLSPFTIVLESSGVLIKGVFVLVAACLICALVLGALMGGAGAVLGFLCGIAITALLVRRDFQMLMRMAGSRRSTRLQVTDGRMDLSRGSTVPTAFDRAEIRRIRLGNTLDANFVPEPVYVVGNGLQGAMAIATMGVRAQRISKLARDCYCVMLDHGNASVVVSDGLDETTAKNVFDDLARDLKMR